MNYVTRTIDKDSERYKKSAGARVNRFVRNRLMEAATIQSRHIIAESRVDVVNRALLRFAELLYEQQHGRLWNMRDDGRICVPSPWSSRQHSAYALTDHERRVLRAVMVAKLSGMPVKYQWLLFDGRAWSVQLRRYPTLDDAKSWLATYPVKAVEWQLRADALAVRRGRRTG